MSAAERVAEAALEQRRRLERLQDFYAEPAPCSAAEREMRNRRRRYLNHELAIASGELNRALDAYVQERSGRREVG